MNIIRSIKAAFAWHTEFEAGAFAYQKNDVTGERRAIKIHSGYSPLAQWWIDGKSEPVVSPPFGGGGSVSVANEVARI